MFSLHISRSLARGCFVPMRAIFVLALLGVTQLSCAAPAGSGKTDIRNLPGNSSPPSWAPTIPPALLQGDELWHGVPSMLWGTNDTQNWDAEHNLITLPAVQQQMRADHLALIRTWLFQTDLVTGLSVTDAYQQRKAQAALATGAKLLCELPTANSMSYDEHLVTLFRNECSYYEFMNEPDNEQVAIEAYVAAWASEVPRLRAIDPNAQFGGPAAAGPQFSQCAYTTTETVCYMQKVLQGMARSGVLPDFVTFHWYPCYRDTAAACMARVETFGQQVTLVRGWLTQYFGAAGTRVPVGVTEWNVDPSAPMPSYTRDPCWMERFTATAFQSMARAGASFAAQFDLANYGGYGSDDMVDVLKDGVAKPQYAALLDMVNRIYPGDTLPMPPLGYTRPAC